jgi:hypothetical protein
MVNMAVEKTIRSDTNIYHMSLTSVLKNPELCSIILLYFLLQYINISRYLGTGLNLKTTHIYFLP